MSVRHIPAALLMGLINILGSQAFAVDCDTAVVLGDKPSMEEYADYSDFLVAIMDHKARDRELLAQQEACPELFVSKLDPSAADPTVTYGPETLDSAVARTERLHQTEADNRPQVTDRTTSRNFRLPVLASTQMENETIPTPLRTLMEAPISERDQQLVLNLLGPMQEDDGSWGSNIMTRQYADTLSELERSVDAAYTVGDRPFNYSYRIELANEGYLTLFFLGEELVRVSGLLVSCTSTC